MDRDRDGASSEDTMHVNWAITYEDDTVVTCGERAFSEEGAWVPLEGYPSTQVILTRKRVKRLDIATGFPGPWITITPPEPVPFFSFARFAASITLHDGEEPFPHWLYALFGFLFRGLRFTWKVLPDDHFETHVDPIDTPLIP